MNPSLYIIAIPSGYYPFVLVGWLRPVPGSGWSDEWEMLGGRVIRRFGASAQLGQLASDGPARDTELLAATDRECFHRLAWGRAIPCDVAAWAKACPMPKGWTA